MSRFTIGITGYGKNPHARCFEDVAKALADALRQLGHEVVDFEKPGRLILFGANNITDPAGVMPPDAIIFNSEQVSAVGDARYLMQGYDYFKKHAVWDYSATNAKRLRELGMENVILCPIGYHPSMQRAAIIDSSAAEDIDVLFYGSVNPRRRAVLDALDAAGLKVVRPDREFEGARPFGLYGEERDRLIARAKVVLNLHYFEWSRAIFEVFRVSHLLANRKCVVTEDGGQDPALEALASRTCRRVATDEVVDACRALVVDGRERKAVAESGHAAFKQIDFTESVAIALKASDVLEAMSAAVVEKGERA